MRTASKNATYVLHHGRCDGLALKKVRSDGPEAIAREIISEQLVRAMDQCACANHRRVVTYAVVLKLNPKRIGQVEYDLGLVVVSGRCSDVAFDTRDLGVRACKFIERGRLIR